MVDGIGDLLGLMRRELPERGNVRALAAEAGRGESTYTHYDRSIVEAARGWLENKAQHPPDKPWMLFVGFVLPHFPLVAPPEFFDLYPPDRMPMPRFYGASERPEHPVLKALRGCMSYDEHFDEETRAHRARRVLRHGLVSRPQYRPGAEGARGDRPSRPTRASSTPPTTATTSATAASGASR